MNRAPTRSVSAAALVSRRLMQIAKMGRDHSDLEARVERAAWRELLAALRRPERHEGGRARTSGERTGRQSR
jgi:hypothetical protein